MTDVLSPLSVLVRALSYVKNALDWPSRSVALPKQTLADVDLESPFRNGHSLPLEAQADIATAIVGLRCTCRPYAIVGLVITIVVHALQRVTDWGCAHISQEVFEGGPSGTNANPAPAIVGESFGGRITAALSHVKPGFIRRRPAHSVGFATCGCELFPQASTRFHFPAAQRARGSLGTSAAIARTSPSRTTTVWIPRELLRRNEAREPISNANKVLHLRLNVANGYAV